MPQESQETYPQTMQRSDVTVLKGLLGQSFSSIYKERKKRVAFWTTRPQLRCSNSQCHKADVAY